MTTIAATKIKAVLYVRVSSVAQTLKGHGAESQAVRCSEFARMKGYEVVRTFEDKAVSGSLVERPGMKALLAYLRKNRKDNTRVIIDDISRLARGLEAHLALRAAIANAGGILESPSIEFGEDSDSQLIEHLLASVSAHARVKNAEQTRNRMEARLRQGYWPFIPCMGLRYETREGHGKVLVRDEPLASIIQEGMEGYAFGRFQSQAEVARFFEAQPAFPKGSKGNVTIEAVNRIFNRVIYAGMVERPDWGISLRKGRHDGLIDFATFEKIQERLNGRSYAAARPDISADFPLRGCVSCAVCDRPLTANWSRSKTGDKHPYYLCFNRNCVSYRKSIRRAEIEGAFESLLESMTPSPSMVKIFRAMFADAWEIQRRSAEQTACAVKRAVTKADEEIQRLLDRIVSSASSETVIAAFEKRIDQLEREKLLLAERHANAGRPLRPFGEMFELASDFLSQPSKLWKSDRIEDKQTVIRLVFAGRLAYARGKGFPTPKISPIFKTLEALKTGNFRMAERVGFEPTVRLPVHRISSAAHSTTLPPLRKRCCTQQRMSPGRAKRAGSSDEGACQAPGNGKAGIECPACLFRMCAKPISFKHEQGILLLTPGRAHHRSAAADASPLRYRGRGAPSASRFSRRRVRYRSGLRQQRGMVSVDPHGSAARARAALLPPARRE